MARDATGIAGPVKLKFFHLEAGVGGGTRETRMVRVAQNAPDNGCGGFVSLDSDVGGGLVFE